MTRAEKAREERLESEARSREADDAWRQRKAREAGRIKLPGLRSAMERTGMSATLVAYDLKLARETVTGYASKGKTASLPTAKAIARTLGTTVEELKKP